MVSMVSKFTLHTFPTCGLYEGPERSEVLLTDAPGRQARRTSLAKNKIISITMIPGSKENTFMATVWLGT